ncbi:Glycerol operon regulatory protein [Leucobacter sp. 7(1)]|uniref:IclR family transcriptional regulator domain-containing protein n=1 Tax=Leucobacter sp. 7(1) TaxID=1255613 RepID=UPI00097EF84D|nr:helix-turn-helix domain-containing protein [Leucobacter sp. 7(1)]SJN11202.1 Glycerol operon regulatory protein [Leucobacter sp. 7(1)]
MTEISKTADKALLVLADLARNGPATLQRLAERTRLNRTVAHRIVGALTARGFVTRTEQIYAVAARVRRLSDAVFPELRRAAHGPLDRLAAETGSTVLLQVLDGDSVIVVEERPPGTGLDLRARLEVGTKRELTECPSGAAVLAALNENARNRALSARDLEATGAEVLREQLAQMLLTGTAGVVFDPQGGVCEAATPVQAGNHIAACVALLAPAAHAAELGAHLRLLVDTARSVERALGNTPSAA